MPAPLLRGLHGQSRLDPRAGPVCLLDEGMGVLSPPAGSSWAVFDGPVTARATSPAPAVALDVGSSVWAAGSPSTSAPEEKGWAKFADFQPFCW